MADKDRLSDCAGCTIPVPERVCVVDNGKGGKGCPTLVAAEIVAEANRAYEDPEVGEFARQASIQEADCYANRHQKPYVLQPSKTRIVEIGEFARKMGYQRLGLAFCVGLALEAKLAAEVFHDWGFEVVSVCCKAGRSLKESIGLTDDQQIMIGTDESMCNPIFQATLLNESKTDLNVLVGLCVGHDSLFFKYSQAPTTVLAAKDRVTGHNPLAALYTSHSYYRKIKYPSLV
jgi:uncharacterized metal-binding protein